MPLWLLVPFDQTALQASLGDEQRVVCLARPSRTNISRVDLAHGFLASSADTVALIGSFRIVNACCCQHP